MRSVALLAWTGLMCRSAQQRCWSGSHRGSACAGVEDATSRGRKGGRIAAVGESMMAEGTATVAQGSARAASCPGCGRSSEGATLLTSTDRLAGGPGTFRVVRCPNCGLAKTEPRLSREALQSYYPRSYP